MTTLTVREARNQFAAVLDRVAAGEEFEITRRGKVVAVLSPTTPNTPRKPTRAEIKRRWSRPIAGPTLPYNPVLKMREEDDRW